MKKCGICNGKLSIWFEKMFDDRHGYPGYFEIWRCKDCGGAETRPKIGKNKASNLYKKYYPRQDLDLSKIRREDHKIGNRSKLWRKGLMSNCQYWVKPGSKVLDVGSGLGYGLLELEDAGCEAYGIDPDAHAKKVAKKFELRFHCGFIEDRPFGKEKFDYVIGSQVLEHTDKPVAFVRMCEKRLRPGGKLILSFPNINSWGRKLFGRNWLHWHAPYHLNHFSKKSIEEMAQRVGLKIEKLVTITPNMWTNLQIRRLVQKPEMGERDWFWDGKIEKNRKQIRGVNWLARVFRWLEEYNLINRVIDVLGGGESFLVTLS